MQSGLKHKARGDMPMENGQKLNRKYEAGRLYAGGREKTTKRLN